MKIEHYYFDENLFNLFNAYKTADLRLILLKDKKKFTMNITEQKIKK